MAAEVTVNSRSDSVFGDKRVVLANVSAAATADYYSTGLTIIQGLAAVPPSTTDVIPNISATAGRVVFNYSGGGAMANIVVTAIGL